LKIYLGTYLYEGEDEMRVLSESDRVLGFECNRFGGKIILGGRGSEWASSGARWELELELELEPWICLVS
jgi:hypothetical protein